MAAGRAWSADKQFLDDVTSLKQAFINADFQDNIQDKINALKGLNLLVSPVVQVEKELEEIHFAEDNMYNIYVTQKGVTGIHTENKKRMDRFLSEIMVRMLFKLQKEGVYTQPNVDPKKAMANFGGS